MTLYSFERLCAEEQEKIQFIKLIINGFLLKIEFEIIYNILNQYRKYNTYSINYYMIYLLVIINKIFKKYINGFLNPKDFF